MHFVYLPLACVPTSRINWWLPLLCSCVRTHSPSSCQVVAAACCSAACRTCSRSVIAVNKTADLIATLLHSKHLLLHEAGVLTLQELQFTVQLKRSQVFLTALQPGSHDWCTLQSMGAGVSGQLVVYCNLVHKYRKENTKRSTL